MADKLAPGMMTDLQGNVVPIPKDAQQEPISQSAQPSDDNMMTDLSGNRVPIPKGSTQEPLPQDSAASRFGSGVVAGTKAMIPTEVPTDTFTRVTSGMGPLPGMIKGAYEGYKQARDEGQPVLSSVASGIGAVSGLDPEGIRERAAKGDVAGIVGESIPSIALTVLGGEHERIGKVFQSDARALKTAAATRESTTATYAQRLAEQETATDQAITATQRARALADEQKKGNPNVTQQHVDDANTAASAAAANARKATQALNDAHNAHNEAGVEVDRLTRKVQRTSVKADDRQTKSAIQAKEDYKKANPPSARNAMSFDRDYDIGRGYLEQHHQNIEEIGSTQGNYDALSSIQKGMEQKVAPYRERYAKEPIQTNVKMDVRDALAENPSASFTERGMAALEDYNLTDPTIEEAEAIRKNLNSAVREKLNSPGMDIQTAVDTDPVFAAKYAALGSLRDGIYNVYEDKGVQGIRELRQDEASIIRLRDDAQRQIAKGSVRLRGSGESGPIRKAIGKMAGSLGAGAGAGAGAGTGIPGATEVGAMGGKLAGDRLGKLIAPGDLTRDELIARSMKHQGGGIPTTSIEGQPQAATEFGPPQPISPIMNLFTPQRENTPLHSDLATHYGEGISTPYLDLEKRFKEDILDKRAHGVPLESSEKQLLGKINLADAIDRTKAAQQIQQRAMTQKPLPRATIPEDFDPLLHPPQSKLAEGMDTQSGIVHDLAHVVVGGQRGIDFVDGVRSHFHPENISSGALMSAPIDWEPFLNEDGEVDPSKFKSRMADIAATYVAGGVANDLYHDIPFTENHHLGADVRILKSFMKNVGFSDAEASKMIAQAADDAAQVLSKPGVQDILQQHAAVREQGLDEKYHISPERAELIRQDVNGALHETSTGKSSGTSEAGNRPNKEDGAEAETKSKDRDSAGLRQEEQRPAQGKGSAVRKDEPAVGPGTESAEPGPGAIKPGEPALSAGDAYNNFIDKYHETMDRLMEHPDNAMELIDKLYEKTLGNEKLRDMADKLYDRFIGDRPMDLSKPFGVGERFKPEPPKFDIPKPKERSTGDPELDERIRQAGGVPGGLMKGFDYTDKATGQPARYPDTALVHHESGSTLNVPTDATAESIRKSLADKTAEYAAAEQKNAAQGEEKTEISWKHPERDPNTTDYIATHADLGQVARVRFHPEPRAELLANILPNTGRIEIRDAHSKFPGALKNIVSSAIEDAKQQGFRNIVSAPFVRPEHKAIWESLKDKYAVKLVKTKTPMFGESADQYVVSLNDDPKIGRQQIDEAAKAVKRYKPVPAEKVIENLRNDAQNEPENPKLSPKGQKNAVAGQLAAHEQNGGSTFTPQGENLAGRDLYAVGSYPERTAQVDKLTPEELAKFKADNQDVLSQPGHAVGTWKDPDTGRSVLDISKTHADRDTAIAAGKAANQKAIYHLGGEGEIPTGGTGEGPQKLPKDMNRAELKTALGVTGDDPRNGLPNRVLQKQLERQREPIPESPKLSVSDSKLDRWLEDESGYHPDLQAVIKDTRSLSRNPADVKNGGTFITPDGQISVMREGQQHPQVISRATGAAGGAVDNRPEFLDKTGAIRTRFTVARDGDRLAVSVPKTGVTPDQVDTLKQAVGSVGRYGNLLLERSDTSALNDRSQYKEFATPKDVEPMLKQIGAHPESPKLGPKGSTVPLMKSPLKIEGTGENNKVNTLDVAKALNQFTQKKIGALELGSADENKMTARAKSLAEDEAKYQLNQNNSGKAWYTTDIGVHDDVLKRMRPELNDPAKMSLFKMSEAVLSSGQKPYGNLKAAIRAWDAYNETGEFPFHNPETGKSWGPRGAAGYGNAMEMITRLAKEKGEQGASDWLLSEHPVRELREYNKSVSGKADDQQLGAMILGPKRGPFAQNLHGIESAFTADMWVSRTWNRWMGTLDTEPGPDGDVSTDAPKNLTERRLMEKSFGDTAKKLNLSTSALQAVLWYYEQGLYDIHGAKKESWSFADAAKRVEKEHMEQNKSAESFDFGENKSPEKPEKQIDPRSQGILELMRSGK